MTKEPIDHVTVPELELKILGVLWDGDEPMSVRQILECWKSDDVPGYTTILKKLQIMEGKGLVDHEREGRAFSYHPRVQRSQVVKKRFSGILQTLFMGNRLDMAAAFLRDTQFTSEELAELRTLIDEAESRDD